MFRHTPARWIGPFAVFMREQAKNRRKPRDGFSGTEAQKFAAKYNRLTSSAKLKYAAQAYRESAAVKKNEHHRQQPQHKATVYSLLMRLLHDPKLFGVDFLDAPMSGKIAAATVDFLSESDKAALIKKFGSQGTTRLKRWSKKDYAPTLASTFVPSAYGNAYSYDSFADMARGSLGTTAKQIFLSVSLLGSGQRPTKELNQKRWNQSIAGRAEEKEYQPLTDVEVPAFERYCADRAAAFKETKFPIAEWFCGFRKLTWSLHKTKPSVLVPADALRRYRELIAIDSQHTLYERVLSSKERSTKPFSPSASAPDVYFHGVVPPSKYASAIPEESVLDIARSIASNRVGKSVYESCVEHIAKRV
jgi:hypothetical protein